MYDKGDVDKILYLKYSSNSSAPFKEGLTRDLQAQQATLLKQQIQQQQTILPEQNEIAQPQQNLPNVNEVEGTNDPLQIMQNK